MNKLAFTALILLSALFGIGVQDALATDASATKTSGKSVVKADAKLSGNTGNQAAVSAAQKLYQQERAACLAGTTGQERDACLREAAAALKEASSGRFNDDAAQAERNRLRRCDDLAAQDKLACERKLRGEGETSGSVQGGGVVRSIVTVVPASAASAPSN